MNKTIRIGLVEDQFLFREGMKSIINSWTDMQVIYESAEGYSISETLLQCAALPHVMLVDLSLPPQGNKEYGGIQVTEMLIKMYPNIKIIILSIHDDDYFISKLIECGAHGYLVKDSPPQEVQEAIKAVHEKGSYINERALQALHHKMAKKSKKIIPLTRREHEILQLVCKQYTAEEIAQELFISVKTVNGHRNNLLQKTGSRNVTGLVLFAIRNHIVTIL